jgi:predicted NACHT family NTPase
MLERDFLTELSREYELSPKQKSAFVTLFTRNDDNDLAAADTLSISASAFRTRMTGVYKKFSIGGKGAGKANKLKNFLLEKYSKRSSSQTVSEPEEINLDVLVRQVRDKVSASIRRNCGTMLVPDREQSITIDSIYTSVNILGEISRNRWHNTDELREEYRDKNFGTVKREPITALEAVERHDKLMILGKPGAGKTTFLKWLAVQCNEGKFHQNRVPFFITLKKFAETEGKPNLLVFIAKQLNNEYAIDKADVVAAKILRAGRAIFLLDGLDEVQAQDRDRVLNIIQDASVSEIFSHNQFVMTCRIAAEEYAFDQFAEVEVADFNDEQIAHFVEKWFPPEDPIKAIEFIQQLKANRRLQELATNPLLLTLLCLSFESTNRFPDNRSKLYQEGSRLLLKTWDKNRGIRREEVCQQLSIQQKEDLLSQVAYKAFERSKYFFEQEFVEDRIQEYIRNLPNASIEQAALQIDSEEVLKSIEAQHGLLVKQAMQIYSFSHLTFQEYFTARWFKKKADGDFGALISHVTDKQWREVFLLTMEMLQSKDKADKLVLGMKREIDGLLAQDEKLQQFLGWVEEKSRSIQTSYKSATTVRAFYSCLAIALIIGRNLFHKLFSHGGLSLDNYLNLDLYPYLDRSQEFGYDFKENRNLDPNLLRDYDLAGNLYLCFHHNRAIYYCVEDKDCNPNFALYHYSASYINQEQYLSLIDHMASLQHSKFQQALQAVREQLPDISVVFDSPLKTQDSFKMWWESTGQTRKEQLREQAIEHRNIGHDWQFSKAQIKLLQKYYDANRLLVKCLNSGCYVSQEVREEIEASLLLPSKQ